MQCLLEDCCLTASLLINSLQSAKCHRCYVNKCKFKSVLQRAVTAMFLLLHHKISRHVNRYLLHLGETTFLVRFDCLGKKQEQGTAINLPVLLGQHLQHLIPPWRPRHGTKVHILESKQCPHFRWLFYFFCDKFKARLSQLELSGWNGCSSSPSLCVTFLQRRGFPLQVEMFPLASWSETGNKCSLKWGRVQNPIKDKWNPTLLRMVANPNLYWN